MTVTCPCCHLPAEPWQFSRWQLRIIAQLTDQWQTATEISDRAFGTNPLNGPSMVRQAIYHARAMWGDDAIETRPSRSGGGYRLKS